MTLEATTTGEIILLQYLLNMVSPTHPVLHLYVNDVTPIEGTILSQISEPVGWGGYNPITLTGTNWTTAIITGTVTGVYSEQTFNFTTGVTCYGYYVTTTTNSLLWVERFGGAPFILPSGGGQIGVAPVTTLD